MTASLSLLDPAKRSLVLDWRETFRAIGVYALSPAPRLQLGTPYTSLRADFYLPGPRQFLCVIPSLDVGMVDEQLMACAAQYSAPRPWIEEAVPDLPLIGLCPGGMAVGWERGHVAGMYGVGLYQCGECTQWWFLDESQSWRCQCCGHYDGNAGVLNNLSTPITPFPALPLAEVI